MGGVTEAVGRCAAFLFPATVEIISICVFYANFVRFRSWFTKTKDGFHNNVGVYTKNMATTGKGAKMLKEYSSKLVEHFVIGLVLNYLEGIAPSL